MSTRKLFYTKTILRVIQQRLKPQNMILTPLRLPNFTSLLIFLYSWTTLGCITHPLAAALFIDPRALPRLSSTGDKLFLTALLCNHILDQLPIPSNATKRCHFMSILRMISTVFSEVHPFFKYNNEIERDYHKLRLGQPWQKNHNHTRIHSHMYRLLVLAIKLPCKLPCVTPYAFTKWSDRARELFLPSAY